MLLAVALKLPMAAVLPMASLNTKVLLAPLAVKVKDLVVPSLLMAPLVVITAFVPLANNAESPPKVIAPV